MAEELKILNGITGDKAGEIGLSWDPDVMVSQGNSTDPGPAYLGGAPDCGLLGLKKRFRATIVAAKKKGIPFILAGGGWAGINRELERVLAFVDEMSKEENIKLRIAVIPGELDKEYLKQKIRAGVKIPRLVDTEALSEYLTEEDVDRSEHIAAQMGPEPIMKALDLDVDGVITGRALDIGLFMALPLKRGFDKGLAAHVGKAMECNSQVTEPDLGGPVFTILRKDHFLIRPADPAARCTIESVAGHSFYERPSPNREENPGGALDISSAKYEQYDDRTVKISGSRWIPAPYTLKLEGARIAGYRSICICGIREERLINCIDLFLEQVRKGTEEKFRPLKPGKDYRLLFRNYGKNGVLGDAEPMKQTTSYELCVIIDVVAPEQEVADGICYSVSQDVVHRHYPGRQTTAANVAYPFSPKENSLGPVCEWNTWHLLPLDDPCEPFKIEVREFPIRK